MKTDCDVGIRARVEPVQGVETRSGQKVGLVIHPSIIPSIPDGIAELKNTGTWDAMA
jgi:hypothetical protein